MPDRPSLQTGAELAAVDPYEADFYARLADTWWDASGPFWPLHRLNETRVQWMRPRLAAHFGRDPQAAQPLTGLRVLDVGCGGGLLSEAMSRLGADVHGIDVVDRNIEVARLHAESEGLDIHYSLTGAETLAATDGRFDVVLNMEVVEHVPDVDGFMTAVGKLIAPGGVLCVATINRTFRAWLLAIVGAEYVLRLLPRGTHRWRKFVRPDEVRALATSSGLSEIAATGVGMNPLRRRLFLQRSLAVNYMLLFARPQGSNLDHNR
jgi:2-polyprenyl-6-hydroxyphenyl methylase/3-demethylubiquinone-9 3-methyltransferase